MLAMGLKFLHEGTKPYFKQKTTQVDELTDKTSEKKTFHPVEPLIILNQIMVLRIKLEYSKDVDATHHKSALPSPPSSDLSTPFFY